LFFYDTSHTTNFLVAILGKLEKLQSTFEKWGLGTRTCVREDGLGKHKNPKLLETHPSHSDGEYGQPHTLHCSRETCAWFAKPFALFLSLILFALFVFLATLSFFRRRQMSTLK
jgi:hypothetical protein